MSFLGRRAAGVLALQALVGCSGDVPGHVVSVHDSAGVRIVQLPGLHAPSVYRDARLLYRHGFEPRQYQFHRIRSGKLLSDGRTAIADIGSSEIVILNEAGDVQSVLGGEGQGPGEIRQLWSMHLLDGDTLVVEDKGNQRVSLYDSDRFVRSYRADTQEGRWLSAIGAEGRRLLMVPGGLPIAFEEPWFRAPLVWHSTATEYFDTIAFWDVSPRLPPSQRPETGPRGLVVPIRRPFRPRGSVELTRGAIVVTRSDLPQIEFKNLLGRTIQIVRWPGEPVPLTDSAWAAYEEYRIDIWNVRRSEGRARLDEARALAGEFVPYIGHVEGDDEGNVWITDYATDYMYSRYWVVALDGSRKGWVELPRGLRVLDIRDGRVLGVQRNDLDVEAAVLFELVEPQ